SFPQKHRRHRLHSNRLRFSVAVVSCEQRCLEPFPSAPPLSVPMEIAARKTLPLVDMLQQVGL
ncbi:MAG: hypothetical protein NTV14_02970, partial [Coprothermobacterota bacterium]|nr:hypothetical protein [Coprothermobacterota bacterium]